jgi:small-conductance mechanosensitive channel
MTSIIGNVSIGQFIIFIIIIIATLFIGNTVGAYIKKVFDLKDKKGWAYSAIPKVVSYTIYIAGFYLGVYKVIQFDIQAFAAAFGIIGLMITFSSQHTLQNIIAGFLILVDRSVEEGDYIEYNGSICKVVDISLRKTYLRASDGRYIGMPNSNFVTNSITNYSKSEFFRAEIPISIKPDADLEKAISILYGLAVEHKDIVPKTDLRRKKSVLQAILELPPDMKKYEPKVFLKTLLSDRTVIELAYWISDVKIQKRVNSEILMEVRKKFMEAGISFGA